MTDLTSVKEEAIPLLIFDPIKKSKFIKFD